MRVGGPDSTRQSAGFTPELPHPPRQAQMTPTDYRLTQLQWLESETIHIIREVIAEFERPVLLFSGG